MGTPDRFNYLLTRYLNGNITAAQQREFFELTATGLYDDFLNASFDAETQTGAAGSSDDIHPAASADMLENILRPGTSGAGTDKKDNTGRQRFFLFAAAAVLILSFAVSLHFYTTPAASDRYVKEFTGGSRVTQQRAGSIPVTLKLADGSRIVLAPKASVIYTAGAFNTSRRVYLNGEAVFYIAKDAAHPFYVYHQHIVTRVLGTSFKIKTGDADGSLEVEVYTGKVKVYENSRAATGQGVIITPNYKALYNAGSRLFRTALADNPQPVADNENTKQGLNAPPVSFVYANTKVAAVVKDLQTAYGIKITVASDSINDCVFTGDITKESLFNKLKVLCLAVNADYKADNEGFTITGSGCSQLPTNNH